MNRALSIRGKGRKADNKEPPKHTFSMSTFRGMRESDLSKKLFKLIKTENHAIGAYETAGRERVSIASQLSDWGESTGDDSISDLSDKIGVLLSEIGEQEDLYAQNLEDYRSILKQIRNTESSVQPSRDNKAKIADEIAKLKYKEPTSPRLVTLEQELVRAEAQNLVAEAQLTNITRQKLKEAYDHNFAATIERAEKQIILAKHGRRIINLLDDTPVVPGDVRQPFAHGAEARNILNDAESELQHWRPNLEPVETQAGGLPGSLVPDHDQTTTTASEAPMSDAGAETPQLSGHSQTANQAVTGHHSSQVEDASNPVSGEGTHLEKAVAA